MHSILLTYGDFCLSCPDALHVNLKACPDREVDLQVRMLVSRRSRTASGAMSKSQVTSSNEAANSKQPTDEVTKTSSRAVKATTKRKNISSGLGR